MTGHLALIAMVALLGGSAALCAENAAGLLDIKTDPRILTTVSAGVFPVAVSINSKTHEVYVPNNSSASVTVIDERSNAPTTVENARGAFSNGVAVNPVTNKIYVAN